MQVKLSRGKALNADTGFYKSIDFIEIEGLRIRYAKKGNGAPIFMLHGWGGDLHSWDVLTKHLNKKNHSVLGLDMPGFGESDKLKEVWTVADFACFFEKFVQKMYTKYGLKGNYDLIVHSFGGRVAIKSFPTKKKKAFGSLNRLILIAPAGIKHTLTLRKKIFRKLAKLGALIFSIPGLRIFQKLARKVIYKILHTHDYERTSGVMRKTFLNVINEDLSDNLEQINCPTLIIWGTDDTYVPVEDAYLMREKVKGSKLRIVKGGRHGIHRTHAKILAGWINEFL